MIKRTLNVSLLIALVMALLFVMPMVNAEDITTSTKIYEKNINSTMSDFIKEDFNSKYGLIRLSKTATWSNPIDRIAEYTLTQNTQYCNINCEAEGKVTLYTNGRLFDSMKFTDLEGTTTSIKTLNYYLFDGYADNYVSVPDTYKTICHDVTDNKTLETTKECEEIVNAYKLVNQPVETWKKYVGEELIAGDYRWKIKGTKEQYQSVDFIPIKNGVEFNEWATWTSGFNVGLVSYYDFTNDSLTNIPEKVYGVFNLTQGGTCVQYASSQLLGGYLGGKNGTSCYATNKTNTNNMIIGAGNATISAWFKTITHTGVGAGNFLANFGTLETTGAGNKGNVLILEINTNRVIWFGNYYNAGDTYLGYGNSTTVPLTAQINSWHQVVIRGSNGTYSMFIDGVKQTASYNYTGKLNPVSNLEFIRRGATYWSSDIDEVGVWNRSLTDAEVSDLYNSGTGITYVASSGSTIVFAGGTGTPSDPYQVANWSNLNATRLNLNANYILINNLSSSTIDYIGYGNIWNPIGNDNTNRFNGTFNGNNYNITNMYINTSSAFIGLFGTITGNITNLNIINADIVGSSNVGSITGASYGGNIINCSVSNSVINGTGNGVGGLVGYLYGGEVKTSYSTRSSIFTTSNQGSYGGIVGWQDNNAIVNSCNSSYNFIKAAAYSGGIVGKSDSGIIINSYALYNNITSFSAGSAYAGGITGRSVASTIINSYVMMINNYITSAGYFVGAIVGANQAGASIVNSSANVDLSSNISAANAVGLLGDNAGNVTGSFLTVTNSYGSITFLGLVFNGYGDMIKNITIASNYVYVNSNQVSLNVSANVTLLGVPTGFTNPRILRNGLECNSTTMVKCYNFTSLNAGTVRFNVSSWSNYSIGEANATVPAASPLNISFITPPTPVNGITQESNTIMVAINASVNSTNNIASLSINIYNSTHDLILSSARNYTPRLAFVEYPGYKLNVFNYDNSLYSGALQWACNTTSVIGSASTTDGLANTALITAQTTLCAPTPASYCDSLDVFGYSDWYLPASKQLDIVYNQTASVMLNNATKNSFWSTNWVDMTEDVYWSSTEMIDTSAYGYMHSMNGIVGIQKNQPLSFRCVRDFDGTDITTSAIYSANFTGLPAGKYYINASGRDMYSVLGLSEIREVTIDQIPNVAFTSITTTNNSYYEYNTSNLTIGLTGSHSALQNMTLYIYNSSGALLFSLTNDSTPSSTLSYNFTPPYPGTFYFNATAYNNLSNKNFTETRQATFYSFDFGLCGSDPTLTVPYLNISFYDESTGLNYTAKMNSFLAVYYILDPTQNKTYYFSNLSANSNYVFCSFPPHVPLNTTILLQYSNIGYSTRTYTSNSIYTNATNYLALGLIPTASTQYVTFTTYDSVYTSTISGVSIDVYTDILGVSTLVTSGITDSAGGAIFALNPLLTYTLVYTKTGYITSTRTINPSATAYSEYLVPVTSPSSGTGSGVGGDSYIPHNNLTYLPYVIPAKNSFGANESMIFYFNVTSLDASYGGTRIEMWSNYSNMINFSMKNRTGTTTIASIQGNCSGYKNLILKYYVYNSSNYTGYNLVTIKSYTCGLNIPGPGNNSIVSGIFDWGNDANATSESRFGNAWWTFFIMAIVITILCLWLDIGNFGGTDPMIVVIGFTIVLWVLSIAGNLFYIPGMGFEWVGRFALAFITTLFMTGYIIKSVRER